jgi:hypothetical protein
MPHTPAWTRPSVHRVSSSSRSGWAALAVLVTLVVAAAPLAADDKGKGYDSNMTLVRAVAQEAVNKMLANLAQTGPRVRLVTEPYHETAWLVEEIVGQKLRDAGYVVISEPPPPPAPPAAGGTAPPAGAPGTPPAAGGPPPGGAPPTLSQLGQQVAQGGGDSTAVAIPDSIARLGPLGTGSAPPHTPGAGTAPVAPAVPVDAELRLRIVELGIKYTGTHRTRPVFGSKEVDRCAQASIYAELRDPSGDLVHWTGNGEATRIDAVPKDALGILEGQHYPFTPPVLPTHSSGKILEPIIVTAVIVGLVFLFVSNRS